MKKMGWILLWCTGLAMAAESPVSVSEKKPAQPVANTSVVAKPTAAVIKKEESSGVSGVLSRLWGKLRAVSPKVASTDNRAATQVAGVRGDEATDSALQPYWKDDNEADAAFVQQSNAFKAAQQLADNGLYADAAKAFEKFSVEYPGSQLKPNAQFGQALSQLSAGDAAGQATLRDFVAAYPSHPLTIEAKGLLVQ